MIRAFFALLFLSINLIVGTQASVAQTSADGTYIGGSAADYDVSVAATKNGDVFCIYTTSSSDVATTSGVYRPTALAGRDVMLERRSAAGERIAATYLGTSADDQALTVASDPDGSVVVVFSTTSTSFLPSATVEYDDDGVYRIIVMRIDSSLTIVISSLQIVTEKILHVNHALVRSDGSVVVVGTTKEEKIQTTPTAMQSIAGGDEDGFMLVLAQDLLSVQYATYAGGDADDEIVRVIAMSDEEFVLVGSTKSADFPGATTAERDHRGASVQVMSISGGLIRTTMVEGTAEVRPIDAQKGPSGSVIVGGVTTSAVLPATSGSYSATTSGSSDGFVSIVDAAGTVIASTYLGSTNSDTVRSLCRDGEGNICIAIETSGSLATTADARQSGPKGAIDAAVFILSEDLRQLRYGSYAAGSGIDVPRWLSVGTNFEFTVYGQTSSGDLPVGISPERAAPLASAMPECYMLRWSPLPRISISPKLISFDTVLIGKSGSGIIRIANDGQLRAATVSSTTSMAGERGVSFSITPPYTIGTKQQVAVTVRWAPETAGVLIDSVRIVVDGDTSFVQLRGISIDSTVGPRPTQLSLLDVDAGDIELTSPRPVSMKIVRIGPSIVRVDSVVVEPSGMPLIILAFPDSISTDTSSIDLSCAAIVEGVDSADVVLHYNGTQSSARVRWNGIDSRQADVVILAPTPDTVLLDTPDTVRIPLKNRGDRSTTVTIAVEDLVPDVAWIIGPPISATTLTLDPGAVDTVLVGVRSKQLGSHQLIYKARFGTRLNEQLHTMVSVLPTPGFNLPNITAGEIRVGSDTTLSLSVVNLSSVSMRIDSITFFEPDITVLTQPMPVIVASGSTWTVMTTISPSDTGERSTLFKVWTSTAISAQGTIEYIGVRPPDTTRAELSVVTQEPDTIRAVGVVSHVIYVTNVGTEDITLDSMSTRGSDTTISLVVAEPLPRILRPGDSLAATLSVDVKGSQTIVATVRAYGSTDTATATIFFHSVIGDTSDTTDPEDDTVQVRMTPPSDTIDIGGRMSIPVTITRGAKWLRTHGTTRTRVYLAFRRSVLVLDGSAVDVGTDSVMRRVAIDGAFLPQSDTIVTLTFTACLGDSSWSDVTISSVEFLADTGVVATTVDSVNIRLVVRDQWTGGGVRTVVRDTTQPAITLYPNPSSGPVSILVHHAVVGAVLELYDITGNLLLTTELPSQGTNSFVSLTLGGGLTPGAYQCIVRAQSSQARQRFVIVR
ncbi:MAG: T9SS type A sorting domain-containing protein [Ignavibacteria bacterium]|nr:T9SS type A sorting domain-containing protein [Ignavibacteria bacterium]